MFRIIKKIGSQYYAFLPLFVPKYIEESTKIYKQYFRNKMWCSIFLFSGGVPSPTKLGLVNNSQDELSIKFVEIVDRISFQLVEIKMRC